MMSAGEAFTKLSRALRTVERGRLANPDDLKPALVILHECMLLEPERSRDSARVRRAKQEQQTGAAVLGNFTRSNQQREAEGAARRARIAEIMAAEPGLRAHEVRARLIAKGTQLSLRTVQEHLKRLRAEQSASRP